MAFPYLVCAGLYLLVRVLVLGRVFGGMDAGRYSDLFLTLPGVLIQYLRHLIFPFGLSPVYDTPYVTSFSWTSVGAPLALLGVAGAGLIYWGHRSAVVPLASAWLVFPLLPVLNLSLLPETDRFHDRFLYLPSVGFALLIGLAVSRLTDTGARAFGAPAGRLGVVLLVSAPLAVGTVIQSSHWKDDLRLFSRAAAVAPGNNAGLNNLGRELIRSGRLDEAEGYLRQVIERAPEYTNALLNLGRVHFLRGEYEQAEDLLLRARNTGKRNPDVHINLGFIHARMGKLDLAEEDFRRAIAYRGNRPGYGNALGVLLRNQGRLSEALAVFEAELALDPGQDDVRRQVELLRARISDR